MSFRAWLTGVVGVLACLSVATGAKMSQPQPGTYAVQRQKGIEYDSAAEIAGEDREGSRQERTTGRTMQAFLPKDVERSVPAVVLIRGSQAEARSGEWEENARWLASHAYAVFAPSYRLEVGRRAAYQDICAAIRHVRENHDKFGIDPNRIGVWGCADGGNLAVALGLLDDQLLRAQQGKKAPEREVDNVSVDTISARIQTVLVTTKTNPVDERMATHVSFDDPPFLLILGSGKEESQQVDPPSSSEKAGAEYVAYRVPGETPCQQLGSILTVDGKETPTWQLILDFADEHLKEAPLNLAVELERVILQRTRAQNWMLGTQSIIDLRAVLQRAAHRLGREPTPQEMGIAREHAKELADELVRIAATGGTPPRITRVVLAEAISRLSPQWPFTTRPRPATVPPVSRRELFAPELRD